MRKFVIYSSTARTDPIIKDLKSAGRIDVLLHSVISSLFISNQFRKENEVHLYLMGPPRSPRHITIKYDENLTISKKNLKKLLEMCLRKCKPGISKEIHPGVFVDDKPFEIFLEELFSESNIYTLDAYGTHIKKYSFEEENSSFILGDHEGFDKKIKKYLKKNTNRLSLGNQIYFTSQSITIINYELDNLGI